MVSPTTITEECGVQEINLQIGYFTHQTRCHQHHIACCTGLTELGNRHFVEWRHWGNTSVLPPMLSLQLKLTWIHGSNSERSGSISRILHLVLLLRLISGQGG
ncbi:hypothetical protein RHMOL_Rhmol10G0106400 [Rhododendron molle]|uniref:Uncharacterized protein n=1 Tax=Rhododendron molle TaxID=49168 RepID=A0ACC0M215_RHOML|nr:hypothetical protein RHMOL_Rhmol10G0106400 [Rhododendron molle]